MIYGIVDGVLILMMNLFFMFSVDEKCRVVGFGLGNILILLVIVLGFFFVGEYMLGLFVVDIGFF